MRASATTCLLIAIFATLPLQADAQLSRLLGFGKSPTVRNAQSRSANNVASQPGRRSPVKQVQFTEAIPSAVMEAAPAVPINSGDTVAASNSTFGQVIDPMLDSPIVNSPPQNEYVVPDLVAPVETPVVEQYPAGGEAYYPDTQGQAIFDNNIGQPYDIPIANVIPEEGAEIYSTNNWFRGGRWYSTQEVFMLLRADLPNTHIAVEPTTTPTNVRIVDPLAQNSLSSKGADFTFEAGTRLTLGKILGRDVANRDHSIEFRFFGLFDFSGEASIGEARVGNVAPDDPDGLTTSGFGIESLLGTREANSTISGAIGFNDTFFSSVPGFDNSTSQDILYRSDLNSFELNYSIGARPSRDRMVMQPDGRWVRHATPSKVRGIYAGLRYIRQNELFRYRATGRPNETFVSDPAGNTFNVFSGAAVQRGEYVVTTDNDLFGIQIGGEMVQKRTDWVFGVDGRIGGLINFADRHSSLMQLIDLDNTSNVEDFQRTNTNQALNDETLTFLGEANLYMAYYVRPNTSLRLGYNFLYMNGLATATNNIGLIGGFPKFELTGDSLYHGMHAGFNMTW